MKIKALWLVIWLTGWVLLTGINFFEQQELTVSSTVTLKGDMAVDALSINLPGAEFDLRGGDVLNLTVFYREYSKGDAGFKLEQGQLITTSQSGHTPRVERIIGSIPADTNLHLETGTAVKINGLLGGSLYVDSGVGPVTLRDLSNQERVEISSGTGRVELGQLVECPQIVLSTGTGNMLIRGAAGVDRLEASSGTGSIELEDVNVVNLRLTSGTGDISVRNSRVGNKQINALPGRLHWDNNQIDTPEDEDDWGSPDRR